MEPAKYREEQAGSGLKVMEKLNFDNQVSVMERIMDDKDLFKVYNGIVESYSGVSRNINKKYFRSLGNEIKGEAEEAYFKLKAAEIVIAFFSQFFKPSRKNPMGIIAKNK